MAEMSRRDGPIVAGDSTPPTPEREPMVNVIHHQVGRGETTRDNQVNATLTQPRVSDSAVNLNINTINSEREGVPMPTHSGNFNFNFNLNLNLNLNSSLNSNSVINNSGDDGSSALADCVIERSVSGILVERGPANVNGNCGFRCPFCDRVFPSFRGLGVHKKSKHEAEVNETIDLTRRKYRWTDEDMRRLATEEAAAQRHARGINDHLHAAVRFDPPRTHEAIKSLRKRPRYKQLVEQMRQRIVEQNDVRVNEPDIVDEDGLCSGDVFIDEAIPVMEEDQMQNYLRAERAYLRSVNCDELGRDYLSRAIEELLDRNSPENSLMLWYNSRTDFNLHRMRVRERLSGDPRVHNSRKLQRRREYAAIQSLWRRNRCKAARKVLDGDGGSLEHPSLMTQEQYWRGLMESQVTENDGDGNGMDEMIETTKRDVFSRISALDVMSMKPNARTAAGPDGLSTRNWLELVSDRVKAILMNVIIVWGRVPKAWADSRTVLIPKEPGTNDPAQFRPISISSIVLRHTHRIIATRITKMNLFDVRQRAFISADGIAESTAVISSIMHDSRHKRRQLHIAFLDIRKAFDSVRHSSIMGVLRRRGFTEAFVSYISALYGEAVTYLEVDGSKSMPIHPSRGVRQGDPLSAPIFNLIMDEILRKIPDSVGYEMDGVMVNALAFADDLVLIASTKAGLQEIVSVATDEMMRHGLSPNPAKCKCASMVPSGKIKKLKIITEPWLMVNGVHVTQIGLSETWTYLGIRYTTRGPAAPTTEIETSLEKITKAPLKPQQRLEIVKTYLLPRYLHSLILSESKYCQLRRMDKSVRKFLRKWLCLPRDVPVAYLHAPVKEGGLGVPAMETAIPKLTLKRIDGLEKSVFSAAVMAHKSDWANKRRRWCLIGTSSALSWGEKLHGQVDGYELRETKNAIPSYAWVEDKTLKIPSKDWIQYVRTRINALPSRMRTTRGVRRVNMETQCRGGCGVPETTAHIIQCCHRTHGGRVRRHDAITKTVASILSSQGYHVDRERHFHTTHGTRKPDIVAMRDNAIVLLDAQVVSAQCSLNETFSRKRKYYADNRSLLNEIANCYSVPERNITVSAITISWRGIWAERSVRVLLEMGFSNSMLTGLTTRVLQGSHTNFQRWNRLTTMAYRHLWPVRLRLRDADRQ